MDGQTKDRMRHESRELFMLHSPRFSARLTSSGQNCGAINDQGKEAHEFDFSDVNNRVRGALLTP
jgi:hypothetical protein